MKLTPQPTRAAEHGFTVVELVVTMVVGMSFILLTNVAVTNYLHLSTRARQLALANSFVEGEVEALRNQGYNSLTVGTTDLTAQLPSALQSPKSASVQITSPSGGIKQIDITVTYNDQVSRSYSYTTYIGELGVGQ